MLLASDRIHVYDKLILHARSEMRRAFSVTHVWMRFTHKTTLLNITT